MQIFDILLLCIVMLVIEKMTLKDKYVLLSPYAMVFISFIFIYIFPLIIYNIDSSSNIIRFLSEDEINNLIVYMRLFIYSFSFFGIISMNVLKKKKNGMTKANYYFDKDFMIILAILSFVVVLGTQLLIVNFNISIFIDKLINPRMYTYYKQSLGPLTYLIEVTKKVYLFASLVYFIRNKSFLAIFFLTTSTLLNILGGTKTSIIIILIFYILVWQKFSKKKIRITFKQIFKYSFVSIIILMFAFTTMSQQDESLYTAMRSILAYPQEAYYSGLVIRDFTPQIEHHIETIRSFIFTPIPRAIYASKEYYGFYSNYWRPIYQPNTVIYHTSTYGLFAEGQMLFGVISTILYALLANILASKLYVKYFKQNKMIKIFFNVFLVSQIYFFMRVGFFDASLLWSLILHYFGASILFKIPIGRKIIIEE